MLLSTKRIRGWCKCISFSDAQTHAKSKQATVISIFDVSELVLWKRKREEQGVRNPHMLMRTVRQSKPIASMTRTIIARVSAALQMIGFGASPPPPVRGDS